MRFPSPTHVSLITDQTPAIAASPLIPHLPLIKLHFLYICIYNAKKVPKGYFAVYVGANQKRFVIPVSFLNQPLFQDLLGLSEEEFGYSHPTGGLRIPCDEDIFLDVTSRLIVLRELTQINLYNFVSKHQ
ncbi:hypothetical protein PTKIN_Ptkin02bG0204500 [Pterospermum kingtungense]